MSLRDKLLANPPLASEPFTLSDGTKLVFKDMPGTERSAWFKANEEHKETCPKKLDAEGKVVLIKVKNAKGKDVDEPSLEPSKTDGLTQDVFVRDTLIIRTACDPETGSRVFLPEDVGTFESWGGADVEGMWQVALKVTGLRRDDVEEAAKN